MNADNNSFLIVFVLITMSAVRLTYHQTACAKTELQRLEDGEDVTMKLLDGGDVDALVG